MVRALNKALSQNNGSIFRYSNHENTVLNQIHFESITRATKSGTGTWVGERNMIDLCQVVKDHYYNLYIGGSNSIKTVLPAALKTSAYLQRKYYKMLPPLFEDWNESS